LNTYIEKMPANTELLFNEFKEQLNHGFKIK